MTRTRGESLRQLQEETTELEERHRELTQQAARLRGMDVKGLSVEEGHGSRILERLQLQSDCSCCRDCSCERWGAIGCACSTSTL